MFCGRHGVLILTAGITESEMTHLLISPKLSCSKQLPVALMNSNQGKKKKRKEKKDG